MRREARIVAALNHPNIVTLYSVDNADGIDFLTMEYVEGRTVDRLIPEKGMEVIPFFDLAVPLCEALAAAHRQGITHRDLKPRNIMMTDDGRVKVLDFGLARGWAPADLSEATTLAPGQVVRHETVASPTETEGGAVIGTFPYMSPEQVQGLEVDHRSDLFALGIVLHEMAVGHRPFHGKTMAELVASILRDAPRSLTSTRPDLPAGVERIVERCLEKNPERRCSTADELCQELIDLRREFVEGRYPEPRERGRPGDTRTRSVAVPDFVNVVRDPEVDWLCTGIAETVAVDLKRIPSLTLVSRDNVFRAVKARQKDGDQSDHVGLGRQLGVDWIVAGRFQRQGNAIRITVECLDMVRGEVVESVKVDGSLGKIFDLQDRIVREMIDVLNVPTSGVHLDRIGKPGTEEIQAYECYARGRRQIQDMTPSSLGKARGFLQQAVDIDPGYAPAHAGLGQMRAMKYISTTDPADLEAAISHLQKAVAIDPEVGESYMWLTYCYSRAGRFGEAVVTGRRAVAQEPGAATAHYFLGCAFLMQSGRGPEPLAREASDHFLEATRLAPRYQAAHQLLGFSHLFRGNLEAAQPALERAAEIERTGDHELARFVGAHALLGLLRMRQDDFDGALEFYDLSLELLSNEDHVYAAAVAALSYCGRGDAYFGKRREDDALVEYRRACRQVMENRHSLGLGWILIRGRLGMARCFHRLGMMPEERKSLEEATDLFRQRSGYDFNWVWEGTDADINLELARYHAVAGRNEEALGCLGKVVGSGWCDVRVLDTDPVLDEVRRCAGYGDVRQVITTAMGAT
ncbi:MAG: protein kinase [Acidobacteriota bacterium]